VGAGAQDPLEQHARHGILHNRGSC
jgi:hypothetical protein